MFPLRLIRNFIFLLVPVLSTPAMADLSVLDVTFSPDAESFYDGESISVSASTDSGVDAEYRFVLQYYNEAVDPAAYEQVGDTGWGTESQYTLTDTLSGAQAGNYRLVAYARASDNPGEFMLNFQSFFFGASEGAQTTCEYLQGKTFVNTSTPESLTLTLGSFGDMLDAISNIEIPIDQYAHGLSTLTFGGTTMEAEVAQPGRIEDFGGADWTADGPLKGSYTCTDNTVNVSATESTTIITSNCGGSLAFSGCPDGEATTGGQASVDREAGTLTTGGEVFALEGTLEDNAPDGGSDSSGGGVGTIFLTMLVLLGVVRRRV